MLCAWLQFAGTKKSDCVFATDTKTILGQIAKFMYLRLCVFMFCVFVFLGTLQCSSIMDFDCFLSLVQVLGKIIGESKSCLDVYFTLLSSPFESN